MLRAGEAVHEGSCQSIRRLKDEVRSVARGLECGVCLAGAPELKQGDVLQCFRIDMIRPKREDVSRIGQFGGGDATAQKSAFAGQ